MMTELGYTFQRFVKQTEIIANQQNRKITQSLSNIHSMFIMHQCGNPSEPIVVLSLLPESTRTHIILLNNLTKTITIMANLFYSIVWLILFFCVSFIVAAFGSTFFILFSAFSPCVDCFNASEFSNEYESYSIFIL